ncbi:MAG TPA: hypothetical protein VKA60_02800 [Blastocatellia bacterium]|nr:hypothetical protein [Blastocatellia bacterium]
MRKNKRTRITVETERLLVISRKRNAATSWCEACGEATRMIGLDEAGSVSGHSQRQIVRLVEAGHLHFSESPHGVLLICLNSLLNLKER